MRTESSTHYSVFGAIGLGAWILFILGCMGWPAWSPDGTRVLFSFASQDTNKIGVGMYDLSAGKVFTLYEYKADETNGDGSSSEVGIPTGQWSSSGQVIVTHLGDKSASIRMYIPGVRTPSREFTLEMDSEGVIPPYPQVADSLYLPGKSIRKLDLNTGNMEEHPTGGRGVMLYAPTGDHLYYSTPTDFSAGEIEFGEMDPQTFAMNPYFKIHDSDYAQGTIEKWVPFLSVDRSGEHLAVVGAEEDRDVIMLYTRAGFDRVLVPKFGKRYRLTNVQWGDSDQTLYAGALVPLDKDGLVQYSIATISTITGTVQTIPVLKIHSSEIEDYKEGSFRMYLQISLSPDGRTIATSTTLLPAATLTPEKPALYLVDVTRNDRHVTVIQYPPPPKQPQKKGRK